MFLNIFFFKQSWDSLQADVYNLTVSFWRHKIIQRKERKNLRIFDNWVWEMSSFPLVLPKTIRSSTYFLSLQPLFGSVCFFVSSSIKLPASWHCQRAAITRNLYGTVYPRQRSFLQTLTGHSLNLGVTGPASMLNKWSTLFGITIQLSSFWQD